MLGQYSYKQTAADSLITTKGAVTADGEVTGKGMALSGYTHDFQYVCAGAFAPKHRKSIIPSDNDAICTASIGPITAPNQYPY